MRIVPLLLAALLLATPGCGSDEPAPEPRPAAADPTPADVDVARPPAWSVVVDRTPTPVFQGSFCWESAGVSMCADGPGATRGQLVDAGSTDSVELVLDEVPVERLRAVLTPLGSHGCRRSYDAPITDLGDGRWRVEPAGPADDYRVDLIARARQGELPGAFRWRTPVAGPWGEPESRLSLVWEPHGKLEGQGFLLTVDGLPVTPQTASATVTATAGNGESLTFDAGEPSLGCAALGYFSFSERGDGGVAQEVAELGPTPFTYEVDLELDGTTYHGTGTYPEPVDTDPDNDNPAPVLMDFDPPLPTYDG